MGSAPFLGGGFGHFYVYAPARFEYAIDRYAMEAKRQLDVLNRRPGGKRVRRPRLTIADIAIWPWYGQLALGQIYDTAAEFLSVHEYIMCSAGRAARRAPAVRRGRIVNKTSGRPHEVLRERHDAAISSSCAKGEPA